ncbi:hypothetical protein AQUCO_00800135v1 [Aquilegia coerulea]|uniref:Oxidation resistance protein 1 n=1 Tax=Aquilegia coerulea TaxID=218851 RepID=A0A2G5EHF9_AQUCA|nr:hypothetical protein AQUCO_00800135v1 [Aquilegia coerulea]
MGEGDGGTGSGGVSFPKKAAHLVSDLTTVLLNPISDSEHTMEKDKSHQESITEDDSEVTIYGPDTSSFTAFLYSLLTSSESASCSNEENQNQFLADDTNELASQQGIEQSSKRKSLFSRGKQSLGRAIYQVALSNGYNQVSDNKVDRNTKHDGSNHFGLEMGSLQPRVETVSQYRLPDISEPSLLLSEKARSSLHASLPVVVQGRKWVLLYSTWRHGISLSTLYRRSMLSPGFCLLVVGDRKGSVFGGLVEAPLRPTSKRKYQGGNNTFVFTNTSGLPAVFRPTGANRYFTLCSTDFLAMGGGSHFALYLDGDLLSGSSSVSETFGNPCLAQCEDFKVKEVELWSFNPPKYAETVSFWRTEAPEICR